MRFTRRDFGKMAAAALPAFPLMAQNRRPIAKPNSRFGGVQIGVISYSLREMTATDILPAIAKLGINEVELMSNHAEAIVGAPTAPPRAPAAARGTAPAAPPHPPSPTIPVTPAPPANSLLVPNPLTRVGLALRNSLPT